MSLHRVALLACLALSGCAAPQVELVNWNTYHLFDGRKHLKPASQWLQERDPSIVALQELTGTKEAEFRRLARAWGHPYAVLHKEQGYAVGLTSTAPIEVVARQVEGFHHGYLHARTHGIEVFVVHFWPGKVHEAEHVAELAQALAQRGHRVLVVGDFNGEVRTDEAWLLEQGTLGQVVEGIRTFDYRITDAFLLRGFIDLVHLHDPEARYTFGSPALIPRWSPDMASVNGKRRRIDFILASENLASEVSDARVTTDDRTVGQWSDHYPIEATLRVHD